MMSFFARRIKQELDKALQGMEAVPREKLVEWYQTYRARKEFSEEEDQELRGLLEMGEDYRTFASLVPDGWFADLLSAVDEMESPRPFFVLAGLAVLGSLVGRKVIIDRGNHRVSVAPSVMLISPAGETRRSTACDFVVYDLGAKAGLNYIADSFSYEAFGDALTEIQSKTARAEALIYAGEMSVLIGKGSYGESIIPKLTDIMGKISPFHWRTVKRGLVTFEKPCINALLTTSPDWLVDHIPAVVFGGGMASRFLMCVQEKREKAVSWAETKPPEQMARLIRDLRAMGQVTGTFGRPEGEAFEWYDEWYKGHSRRLDFGEINDERMRPYLARKHDHLLRVTALLTIAAREPLQFTTKRFEQALRILDWLETDVPKAYSAMALTPQAVACRAVVRALEMAGGSLDHSALHKKVYRQCPLSAHFKEVVQTLLEMGSITVAKGLSGKGKLYVLRNNIYE